MFPCLDANVFVSKYKTEAWAPSRQHLLLDFTCKIKLIEGIIEEKVEGFAVEREGSRRAPLKELGDHSSPPHT